MKCIKESTITIKGITFVTSKACTKCGEILSIDEFYKSKKNADKHFSICKECHKKGSRLRDKLNSKDPKWVFTDRMRRRVVYARIGRIPQRRTQSQIKTVHERYKAKYAERFKASAMSADIKAPEGSGLVKHHFSYKIKDARDIIFMTVQDHQRLHCYLRYSKIHKCYKTLGGKLLDTMKKHIIYYNLVKDLP